MPCCSSSSGSMSVAKVGSGSEASSPMRARLRSRSSRTAGSTCSGRICTKRGSGSWPSKGLSIRGAIVADRRGGPAPAPPHITWPYEVFMGEQFDLVVIGGGSGGLAAAQRAAEHGARAVLIESGRLGGTCVNVGCVPKKIMWNAAELGSALADAREYGFEVGKAGHDWHALKHARDLYVRRLNDIHAANLDKRKVELVRARAAFLDAHTVSAGGRTLSAPHIIVATGARPQLPPIPGVELGITSDGF